MRTTTALAFAAAAALSEQAIAVNPHRHVHQRDADKRDVSVFVETATAYTTEWVTVTVDADSVAKPTAEAEPAVTTLFTMTRGRGRKPSKTPQDKPKEQPAPTPEPAPAPAPSPAPEAPKPEAPKPETTKKEDPAPSAAPVQPPNQDNNNNNTPAPSPAGGKRGVAYNKVDLIKPFSNCKSCSWTYNWDSRDNGLSDAEISSFVPLLWGTNDVHTSRWKNNVEAMLAKNADHILSFNEPDNGGQANLTPEAAAQGHVKYMNPYGDRAKIGGPAVTNSNLANEGVRWLKPFMDACNGLGCKIDFCVAHWYSPHDDPDSLFTHIEDVSKICGGKKVWLTEFAPLGSPDQIAKALPDILRRLDEHPLVERYAYFMASEGSMLDSPSSLSTYGKIYASS